MNPPHDLRLRLRIDADLLAYAVMKDALKIIAADPYEPTSRDLAERALAFVEAAEQEAKP